VIRLNFLIMIENMKSQASFREVSPEASNKRPKTSESNALSSSPMKERPQELPEDQRYGDRSSKANDDNISEVSGDCEVVACTGSDVLTLDIGGEKIVKTLRSTLTCASRSKLAEMFSGRWDGSQPKDQDGYFFIDYKPSIFLPLLDFLRSLSSMTPLESPPITPSFATATDEASFRTMVDAFSLNNLLYNYEVYQLKPDRPFFGADRATVVSKEKSVPKYVMNSERGVAFVLDRPVSTSGDCHSRRVQAFEVTFIKDDGIKVGWTRRDIYRTQPINGMGKSISIDSRLALPGQHHFHDTAVIRCSKDIHTGVLTWYVDGKELVSTSHNLKDGANKIDDVVYVASGIASDSELIPLVVPARGSSCRFSAIELEP
jgi:hypothetical protein